MMMGQTAYTLGL